MSNIMESHKIMMFLMGSNEEFVSSKDHNLLMEPLHAVSMAFSLLLKVEKQRVTQLTHPDTLDLTALLARTPNYFGNYSSIVRSTERQERGVMLHANGYKSVPGGRGNFRRLDNPRKEKENLRCEHCNMNEHTIDTCFRLHGFLNWYKNSKTQKSQLFGQAHSVHLTSTETPLDTMDEGEHHQDSGAPANID